MKKMTPYMLRQELRSSEIERNLILQSAKGPSLGKESFRIGYIPKLNNLGSSHNISTL